MSREVIGRLKHNLAVSTVSADNENYQVSLTIKDAREALALLEAEQHREASHEQPEYLESLLHQACDIIDRLTTENERLKKELESRPDFSGPAFDVSDLYEDPEKGGD